MKFYNFIVAIKTQIQTIIFILKKQKHMSTYTIYSFQTLNLPTVQVDTDFIIYDDETQSPGDQLYGIIYTGRIVAGYKLEHIDEILSQYVYVKDLSLSGTHFLRDGEQRYTFYLYKSTDDWATFTLDTITVIYDWSYDFEPLSVRPTKSSIPINVMDFRQYAIQSMMSRTGQAEPVEVYVDGPITIDNFTLENTETFTYFRYLSDPAIEWQSTDSSAIWINNYKYTVTNTCFDYCLYYVNQWGGYDYMLFAGRELKTDTLSRLSYKQQYRTQIAGDWVGQFGDKTYQTTIKEHWSLNTSWLNDIQSEKMKHLFSSNKMWLQDLNEEVNAKMTPHLIPVNITNASHEHKNWKNQDRQLYSYTIELEASQTKYRV